MIKKITGTALLAFALISGFFGASTDVRAAVRNLPQQQTDKMSDDKMSSDKMMNDKMTSKKKKKKMKKSSRKMSKKKMKKTT